MLVFCDDILIYNPDMTTHYIHLSMVLNILHEQKLYVNGKKCVFGQSRIAYLRHIITETGVEEDRNKITTMVNWLLPKTLKELRDFFGTDMIL